MSQECTIYVLLLEEGVDCWRPVSAQLVRPGVYQIVTPQPDPDLERWEFNSGQEVECEERSFERDVKSLVAVRTANQAG